MKSNEKLLSQNAVQEMFNYDQYTGILTWRCHPKFGTTKLGKRVGYLHNKCGYRNVKILGSTYREHRVIWLYMTGKWPDGTLPFVDHINRIRDDNRWSNLRLADYKMNRANRSEHYIEYYI